MYEWIRGNIASFLSTASATPHVSVPNRSSAVPVKRSYQSVQTSNDEIEWISVKRQRLGEFVNTVKKSVSGFVTYIRSVAPFGHKVMQVDSKSTKQKKPDQPVKQILSSSLTDISYCGAGQSLPRTDLNLDVEHKSKRRHCGNETNWHEFGNIKQRSLSELPGETSEQLPFPLKHHSLPSTPSPLKKNVRSHHCTNIEKNDKERYQLLLRLVAAGLDKKCKQQPSVSASKPAQCVSSNPSQYRHTKAESNDGLNDCENNQIALPTLKLDSASMRLQPSGIESSKNSLTSGKKFHIFVLNGRPITLRVWPRHYTVQPRETAFQHRNRPYGSSVWKNSNTAKSTLVNANVRYKQVSYDDQSEVLQTTRSNPSARMKGRITEQHIECDLSDEVAARLYLDEGNATESVKMPPSQNVKENLSILSKERRADLPQFTERMVEEVKKALDPGEPDEVLSTGFKLRITRRDIGTLHNYSWLNDEIINFYMCLLMERSKDASLPKVYAFSTFFYLKLHTGGYQTVKQWTKGIDLFEKDLILVPVHLGVHWCLTVADLRKKTILHLDSMGQWNDDLCWILLRYLQEESKNKKGRHLDSSEWVLRSMRSNEVPQQMNGSDCGVFVCKYADYIARDEQITFTQHDIPYFRMKMVWEILHKRML